MLIRPLSADDRVPALRPAWGDPLPSGWRPQGRDGLAVSRGGRKLAVLLGRPLQRGWRFEAVHTREVRPEYVLAAVADLLPTTRLELQCPPDGPAEAAAVAAGFRVLLRAEEVVADLDPVGPPARRRLTFRPFREGGARGLVAVLERVWEGGRGPTGQEPEHEVRRFVELAGGDTSLWRTAYHDGEPAGAALPLRIPDEPDAAALLYLGVVRDLRGRGLGAALHNETLWALRRAGIRRYEDATGRDNLPMRRLLERAGCRPAGSWALCVRDGRPAATRRRPPGRVPLGPHVSLARKVPACSR